MLAGVSVDYYTKLERGAVGVVSEAVLDAVARALQLTPIERDHLFHLTGTTASIRTVSRPARTHVRPSVQRILDGLNRESPDFQALWRSHDVRAHDAGFKSIHHPIVGDLHLTFEAMALPADPGQNLIVYGAEPDSETADRLRLLASWIATNDEAPSDASS